MSINRIFIQVCFVAIATLVTACDAEVLFQTDLRGKSDAIGDDTDGDGISDRDELSNGLDPKTPDAGDDPDGDGLTNIWEIKLGYDPHVPDSGALAGNGVSDCEEDNDADGAKNCWEIANGFDPLNAADLTLDADGDGFANAEEAAAGTDPKAKADHPGPTPSFTTVDDDLEVAGYTNNQAFRATLGFCNEGDLVFVSASNEKPADETGFVGCTKVANALKGKLGSTTEGEQAVYIWRKNSGGIVESPLEGKIVYDVTGPKGDLSVISEEVGESFVTITLPTDADYVSQILRRIPASDCAEDRPDEGTGLTVEKTTTSVADSGFEASTPQCYRIFWYDVLGNEGGLAVVLSPPPAPNFVSLGFANGAVDTYVNAAEHALSTEMPGTLTASNYDTAEYKLATLSTTCDQSLTYGVKPKTDSADFGADGNYKICVKLVGVGGSMAFGESATLKLDTVAPSFTSIALANESLDGTVNVADHALTNDLAGPAVGTGHDSATYKLAPSATACDAALTYGAMPKDNSTQFGAPGNYKVCAKLSDAAGNPAAYNGTSDFAYDATAPVFTSLPLANEAVGGFINDAEKAVANDVAGPVAGSGYTTDEYVVVASTTTCNGALTYGPMPQNPAVTPDGTYRVCAKLSDAAGNVTYGSSSSVVRDTSVPSFTSVALANEAVDAVINMADHLLTNNLVAAAVGAGHTTVEYKVAKLTTTCDGALTYSATIPQEDSPDFSTDEDYQVCVKLSDAAGNPPAFGNSATITYDNTAPIFTSLAFANEAVGGFINAAEHVLTNDMAGVLAGSGYTVDSYKLENSAATCNGSLTYGANPKDDSSDFGADGNYKICAKLTDAAGNTAFGSTTTLVLDTSLPVFTSLTLIDEAADGLIDSADHALTNDLAGTLAATGHTSATYALVTNGTTCNVALTYGAMPRDDSASFTVDGGYKVCVKLTDSAGNPPAYGGTSVILYDTDGLIGCSRSVGHDYYYEGSTVTLIYDCDTLISSVTNPDGNKPTWLTITSPVDGTSTQLTYSGTAAAVTGATVVDTWEFVINGDTTKNDGVTPAMVTTGDIDAAGIASTVDSASWVGDNTASSYNFSINPAKIYDLDHTVTLDALWDGADSDVLLWANSGTTDMHGLTISTPPPACSSAPSSPYLCNGATTGAKPTFSAPLNLTWRWSYFDQGDYFIDVSPRVTIEGATFTLAVLGDASGGFVATTDPAVAAANTAVINHTDSTTGIAGYDLVAYPYGIAIDPSSSVVSPTVGLLYYAKGTKQYAYFREVVPSRAADSTAPSVTQGDGVSPADLALHGTANSSNFGLKALGSGEWGTAGSFANAVSTTDVYFARVASGGASKSKEEAITAHTSDDNVLSVDLSEAFTESGETRMGVAYAVDDGVAAVHLRIAKVNPYAVGSVNDDADFSASGTMYDDAGVTEVDRVKVHYKSGHLYVGYRDDTDLQMRRIDTTFTAGYNALLATVAAGVFTNGVGAAASPQTLDFDLGIDGSDTIVASVYRKSSDTKCYFSWVKDTGAALVAGGTYAAFTTAADCFNPSIHYNATSGRFVITYALKNGSNLYDVLSTEVTIAGGVASTPSSPSYPLMIIPDVATVPLKLTTEFMQSGNWMAIFYRETGSAALKFHGYHVPQR